MALSNKGIADGSGQPQPYYIDDVTIKTIEDKSGEYLDWMNTSYDANDLAIRATLDIGRDFDPEFYVGGRFGRDARGVIEGWGGAFKVAEFFAELGIESDLTPDNKIPKNWLEAALHKELVYLRYVLRRKGNGDLSYGTYNRICGIEKAGSVEAAEIALEDKFFREVENGWVKKYRPEVINKEDPSAPSSTQSSGTSTEDAPF